MVPPLQEYLNQLQAKAQSRLRTSGQAAFLRKQCKGVSTKLRKRRVNAALDTPGTRKTEWALTITEGVAHTPAPAFPPPCMEEDRDYRKQLEDCQTLQRPKG